eukprot:CAMPEP_0171628520 /NCGR_PEP_ID=MMETSP0990-20121206/21502_1 /TAXON_ID=483369 /ORGANISM="non described non described, Strain CCMP2098" /LENGTH=123 /DNA_ID=CAMNT_0012196753 /DNA_START=606 /DNA_END=975 /DNA_ORIENTATION=-
MKQLAMANPNTLGNLRSGMNALWLVPMHVMPTVTPIPKAATANQGSPSKSSGIKIPIATHATTPKIVPQKMDAGGMAAREGQSPCVLFVEKQGRDIYDDHGHALPQDHQSRPLLPPSILWAWP